MCRSPNFFHYFFVAPLLISGLNPGMRLLTAVHELKRADSICSKLCASKPCQEPCLLCPGLAGSGILGVNVENQCTVALFKNMLTQ